MEYTTCFMVKVYWTVHFWQNTDVGGIGIFLKGSFVQIIVGSSKKIRAVTCVLICS